MSDPKTSIASYSTAAATFLFGMTVNELTAYVGIVCAFGTFIINWYYKRAHLKMIERRLRGESFGDLAREDV